MDTTSKRLAYDCVNPVCKGWRWVADAKKRGEKECIRCGTLLHPAAVRAWSPLRAGAKGKGRGRDGGKGGKGAGGQGGPGHGQRQGEPGPHHLQGCKGGGATAAAGGGPRTVGFQAQERYPLQGGAWGGKGTGKSGGKNARPNPKKELTEVEDLTEKLSALKAVMGEDHPYAVDLRGKLEDARRREEAKRTPAEKATKLRAELSKAYDGLATTITEIEDLEEKRAMAEKALEEAEEKAQAQHLVIQHLKKEIGAQEAMAQVRMPYTSGGIVDTSPEATDLRKCDEQVATYIAVITKRTGQAPDDEDVKSYREDLYAAHSRAWGRAVPVPADEQMDTDEPDESAAKRGRCTMSEEERRADALMREGGDASDDGEDSDEFAQGWKTVGPSKRTERLLRKLQLSGDAKLGDRVAKLGEKKKPRAKPTQPATAPQSGAAPATPQVSNFDSRRWSERHAGVPNEADIHFPPLQGGKGPGAGTPRTVSATGQLSGAGPATTGGEPAGIAPPAQGMPSTTGGSSGSAAGSTLPAAPGPPAEGSGNGEGGGSTA